MSTLRVAVIQMNAGPDKADNIQKALDLCTRALRRGAEVICLPEVFNFRGPVRQLVQGRIAESIPGPTCRLFQDLARQRKACVLLGSIYERLPGTTRLANTSVLIDNRGRIAARYRKIHLFQARLGQDRLEEPRLFRPGRRRRDVAVGGFRLGLSVCYDVRFPRLYRAHAAAGCNVLSVPASFTRQTGEAHWKVLVRARAVENLSYVLAPNQFGLDGKGVRTHGHSLIVSPWGEVLAEASGDREEVLVATLDRRKIDQARAALPGVFSQE